MGKWIRCDDRLPERGKCTWVFVNGKVELDWFDGGRGTATEGILGEKVVLSGWYDYFDEEITFWMPLERPLPPEGTE